MTNAETVNKKILRLVLPISFQQFMLALVGAGDAVMLGKLNQNSMSAVSVASQVTFVFHLFMTAFIIRENMFAAQYYGKEDYDNISKTPVLGVYFVLNLDEIVKLPAVYRHYRKYGWLKNIT